METDKKGYPVPGSRPGWDMIGKGKTYEEQNGLYSGDV